MAKRSVDQWNRLGDAQRKRYLAAGRTGSLNGKANLTPAQVRRYYLDGGDLGGGRGRHPGKGAAPRKATNASSIGRATDAEVKQLRSWRKNSAPKWLPKSQSVMGDDTAAILSQIGLQPRNWKDVIITQNENGTYTMTVTSKRSSRVAKVLLPDRDSVLEVRNLFNANTRRELVDKKEAARLDKYWSKADLAPWQIGFDIRYISAVTNVPNTPTPTGRALPTNRKKRK